MTVAVHVRALTQRQAQAQAIEQQLDRLRAHLRAREVELASEAIFRDDGYSGATLNRPGLDRLRDAARAGEVAQLERLTEAYLLAVIPLAEYERRRRALEQRLQALGAQAGQLEAQVDRRAELAGWAASAAAFCQRVRAGLADADFARKRQLVELLIDRVPVADDEVEIRYVIPLRPDSERVRFCSKASRIASAS